MKKGDITYQDKLNELKLDISHPNSKGINFVFVEGESDIKLFRKLFDLQKCKVENIPGGNPKLEECVSDLVKIYPLIIGIRDSDFIQLNGGTYTKRNMFLTDFHDIEMTMLSQSTVLNALVFEFTDLPEEKHLNFRNEIIKTIEMVSYLKWLNNKENLELKFSAGFQDLISFANLNIDFSQYIKRIISKSDNAKIKDEKVIRNKIIDLIKLNPDALQLTNGRDLLKAFAKYFREKTGHSSLNDKSLASAFRMTFTVDHFKETNLFSELEKWEIQNTTNLFTIKASA